MLRKVLLLCFFSNVVFGFVDDGQLGFRQKTYIIGSKKFSWDKAFTYCAEKGMSLLSPDLSNKWLTNYLEVKINLGDMRDDLVPPYWVSALCDAKSGRVKWILPDDNVILQSNPSDCSHISSEERMCVTIYNQTDEKYTFTPCYTRHSFICEN